MEALVSYYRKFEPDVPDFRARREARRAGAGARASSRDVRPKRRPKQIPMAQVLGGRLAAPTQPLTFTREGTGTLFYTTRLRYAVDQAVPAGARLRLPHRAQRTSRSSRTATRPAATTYQAGDLVRVTLTFRLTKERRFVAVTDPLPAGFEPVESWFATTAAATWRAAGPAVRGRGRRRERLGRLVARRRLRSRRAARRPRPAVRHAAERRPPHVQLRRARDDRRHVPHGAGARGRDVRRRRSSAARRRR